MAASGWSSSSIEGAFSADRPEIDEVTENEVRPATVGT